MGALSRALPGPPTSQFASSSSLLPYGTGSTARAGTTVAEAVTGDGLPWENMSGMHHQPDGAAFDIVLLLHVGCVVVGLVTTAAAAATANRLRRLMRTSAPLPEPLRRYFRPGINWAGRTMYGIPLFGFALLAMSQDAYALGDGWVLGGLGVFAVVALLAEGVLWPAERRLQRALGSLDAVGDPSGADDLARDASSMARAAEAVLVLLVIGIVLMISQP